jgi:TRAP-type C4-dicarboxylate transport system substrate-binding protein
MKRLLQTVAAAALLGIGLASGAAAQTIQLKASHQWPGGTGDMRDEMVQIIAWEVNSADVGLEIRVFPGASLFKPTDQWNAMIKGQLDITAFPLDYAGGKHPQFHITLMPGLVKNHEHARRLNDSPFMQEIKKIMEEAGVIVLADTWLAGGFASKQNCILEPDDIKGQVTRAAGAAFEEMLAAAGASIASMPSSEIYTGMQTGVLDATNTSSESFVSYRLYEQVKCITAPGENALWFMYEPILMSKRSFERLNEEQQKAIMAAAAKAEEFAYQAAKESDANMIEVFEKAGVEVVTMTAEQAQMWRDVAANSSYKSFAEKVPGGRELLDMALAVE